MIFHVRPDSLHINGKGVVGYAHTSMTYPSPTYDAAAQSDLVPSSPRYVPSQCALVPSSPKPVPSRAPVWTPSCPDASDCLRICLNPYCPIKRLHLFSKLSVRNAGRVYLTKWEVRWIYRQLLRPMLEDAKVPSDVDQEVIFID